MSWAAVIAGGVALAGAAISAKGAKDASKRAGSAERAQLDFAQQQYDDWQAVYGPVEQNLADYYSSVSPEYYEAVGVEAIEGEYEVIREDIERSLAQRGLSSSGAALSIERDLGIQEAEAKAEARRDAPRLAAEDQSRFLQIGRGINPSADLSNTLAQQASTNRQLANNAQIAAGQAAGNAANVIGTGLSEAVTAYGQRQQSEGLK